MFLIAVKNEEIRNILKGMHSNKLCLSDIQSRTLLPNFNTTYFARNSQPINARLVLEYNSTGSPRQVIERFEERFPDCQPPCTRTILRNFVFDTWEQPKLKYLKVWKTTNR